ncbi:FAD-containing monooxygenase EthA, partial [Streptomyces sp. DSM 41640]|nr:FAD-containing monooxygenase EthA [Streptomyces sp. DSM 41640]
GYYNYDEGYSPEFPGEADFKGQIVHPQHWPEDLDYTGKNVVVIGSGATAITLIPSLVSGGVGHVTMLQRSPTYVGSLPLVDPVAVKTNKYLPKNLAHFVNRWKQIGYSTGQYQVARRFPSVFKQFLRKMGTRRLPE